MDPPSPLPFLMRVYDLAGRLSWIFFLYFLDSLSSQSQMATQNQSERSEAQTNTMPTKAKKSYKAFLGNDRPKVSYKIIVAAPKFPHDMRQFLKS